MKYVVLFFFICLGLKGLAGCKPGTGGGSTPVHANNRIDSIHSASAIDSLVRGLGERYSSFEVNSSLKFSDSATQKLCDSLGVSPWTKADFDGNGHTDLLVFGKLHNRDAGQFCIMDKGKNNFFITPVILWSFHEAAAVVKNIDNRPELVNYFFSEPKQMVQGAISELNNDTLVFRFDGFIERNPAPAHHVIERIKYSTTGCFGSCPVFSLVINANRSASFEPIKYNERGITWHINADSIYHATIDSAHYNQLTGLLNYIDFEKLKDKYAVGWVEDQGCILIVTYDNGKTKKIDDYGLLGSFGLNKAYSLLSELRENQDWK